MKLYRDLNELPESLRHGAITIGNFDGVHLGHARIIERMIRKAHELDGASIVFTFDPHPVRLLRPEVAPLPLTWPERKAELLGDLGVEAVMIYPTDYALLSLTPREFFESIVLGQLHARAIVEGPNFYFGHGRSGNVQTLSELCREHAISLDVVAAAQDGEVVVSSSLVRRLVSEGNIDDASRILTRPYRIRGKVARGAGRGATIGFPTANLEQIDTVVPGLGVYAGRAFLGEKVFDAAINMGPNPTFDELRVKVEVHLLELSSPIYDESLEVEFLSRLRDVRKFGNADELIRQLANDVQAVRDLQSPFEKRDRSCINGLKPLL